MIYHRVVYTGSRDNQSEPKEQLDESSDLTAFDLRIYDLEIDLKQLNENFEELIFQIDDLKQLYEELNLNIQFQNNQNKFIIQNENGIENDVNKEDIDVNKEDIDVNKEDITDKKNSLGSIVIISSEDLSDQQNELIIENENVEKKITNLSPEDEFQRAFDMLRSQQFTDAKNALKKFIDNHKEDKLSGAAHYWLRRDIFIKKRI